MSVLKCLGSNHPQQIIVGHLNINYLKNKFELMKPMLIIYIAIFLVKETKSDDTFPFSGFDIENFSTHCLGKIGMKKAEAPFYMFEAMLQVQI